jgi:nicotinate-nucleotide adenylyltransferase
MRIGLLFGSFNPVHNGHMMLANYFACFTELDEVWMVLSPQNPFKSQAQLLAFHHRYQLLQKACEDVQFIKPCDVESKLDLPSYTSHTLVYLCEKYPAHQFSLILGSDNLLSFHKWKNYDYILHHFRMLIYPRPGFSDSTSTFPEHSNIVICREAPLIEISASFIRKAIAEGRNIRYFMPHKAFEYMDEMNFYKSTRGRKNPPL